MKRFLLLFLFLFASYVGFAQADIVVTNTDGSTSYVAGQNRVYTVTITNNGPLAAQNIAIVGTLTTGVTLANVTWSGSNGTSGTGNLNATVATLANAASVIYTVTVPIPSNFNQTTNLVHQVSITSTTIDPLPNCPGCTDTNTPNPLADIVTVKTNNQIEYLVGETVVYIITVNNNGPSDAVNVLVKDAIPIGLNASQMSWTSSTGASGTGALLETSANLPLGQTITYNVSVFIPTNYTGNFINQVIVTSGTTDPAPNCSGCIDADFPRPNFVTVDSNTYTVTQLIKDVLINEPCVSLSSFTSSDAAGFGSFKRNNSNFPFKEGIIIRTGTAAATQGKYSPTNNTTLGSNQTDPDLNVINGNSSSNDRAFVKFNFIPTVEKFSFNFLFASNEYGTFQCTYGDTFAFILTNLSTGVSRNLAVVPGSVTAANPNGTRVSVVTIRDGAYNSGSICLPTASINAQYFDRYNATGTGPNAGPVSSAINMIGQTVAMTASADVVPGTQYSIKLVIADHRDQQFDSAVFLEAGSFVIGGPRITGTGIFSSNTEFAGTSAFCENSSQTIQAGIAPVAGVTYSWLKNDVPIAGASNFNLEVTTPGTYTVVFSYGNGCQQSDDIIIEFQPVDSPLMAEAEDLYVCNSSTATFNLTLNEPVVMAAYNVSDYDTYYFTSLVAAQDPNPSLTSIPSGQKNNFAGTEGQQIWMKMINSFASGYCNPIKTFKLYFTAAPSGTFSYTDDGGEAGFCINSNSNLLPTAPDLTAGGAYSAIPSGLEINPTSGALNLNNSVAGNYTVKYSFNSPGCDPFAVSTQVVVNDCLTTSASNSGNVCLGTPTFKLMAEDAGTGVTYEWKDYNGVAFSTDRNPVGVLVPTTAGSYTYSVIALLNGSVSEASFTTLIVHPTPAANFITTSTTICTNATKVLEFTGTPNASLKFTDGTNTYTIPIDATGNADFTTSLLTVNTTFTLVTVTGTTLPACSSNLSASILITVGLPTATIVGFTNNESVICSGNASGLEIQGTPFSVVTYTKNGVVQPTVTLPASGNLAISTQTQSVTTTTNYTYDLTTITSNSTPPCSNTLSGQSAILTVNALPSASISADTTTVCEGTAATIKFFGTPNATVFYNNGTVSSSISLDATGNFMLTTDLLSTNTNYTLISVDLLETITCSQNLTGSVTIAVNSNPVITVDPTGSTKCVGEAITFTVGVTGANLTYEWFFNGTAITGAESESYSISTAASTDAGSYTVKVTGSCGPTVTSNAAVLILTKETLITEEPAANTIVCVGQPFTLSATATGVNDLTYQWFRGSAALTGQNSDALNIGAVTVADAGNYTVKISNSCQVVTSEVAILTVNESPKISTQLQGTTVCEGQAIALNVITTGTDLTYEWFLNGNLISGATTATYTNPAVSLSQAGNYSVKITGYCTPTATSTAMVVVNQAVSFTQQPSVSTIVCSGEEIKLKVETNGGTAVTYQWFRGSSAITGATAATYTLSLSAVENSGNYICKVTVPSCGTITSDIAVVVVNQAPVIVHQPKSREICVNQAATFTVNATGTNLMYQWFKGNSAISGATNNTYAISDASEADSGNFYCIITSTSCPNIQSDTSALLVKPLPFAAISTGSDSTICSGESTQVMFTGTAGAVVRYTINGGTPETITLNAGVATILPTGILKKTTVYELLNVTYTGPDACSQTVAGSATITVNPLPKVALEDGVICVDPITLATTRNFSLDTGLNEVDYTFEWFDSNGTIDLATKSFYDATVIGQYGVTITDIITRCQATAYANVDEASPPLDFDYTVTGFFENNPTIVITATPVGNYEYQLDFGPFQESNVFDNITSGTHSITVRDPEACGVLVKDVLIVDYPRYFTPNGDGINDLWNIRSINGISFTKIYIFDRFGKLVKEISTAGSGWDGTFNGKQLPATDYWFTLNYQGAGISKEFRAHFSLKR